MAKYFTIEELTRTSTGLDNTPNEEETKHLEELIDVLDGLREAWGSGIRVNSGFRSEEVNNKVGGSKTSAHRIGFAGDLEPVNGDMKKFQDFVPNYFKENNIPFRPNNKGKTEKWHSNWMHLGYIITNTNKENRNLLYKNKRFKTMKPCV